jgi:hypothetical protein
MQTNYLAFGSNVASHRLLQRLPMYRFSRIAKLKRHRLSFQKTMPENLANTTLSSPRIQPTLSSASSIEYLTTTG